MRGLLLPDTPNSNTHKGTFVYYQGQRLESTKERPIVITGTASAAHAADWDGDGNLDLLVGDGDGGVSLFRNTGDTKFPELASAVQLVPPVERTSEEQSPKDVRRGSRSKICVTDWNEDGLLDLLVGDFANQKPDLPEPTPEQKAEHTRLRKEQEKVRERYRTLSEKLYGKDRVRTKEQIEQLEKEQQEVRKRMTELRSKLPAESERHGWVWLFLRKKI